MSGVWEEKCYHILLRVLFVGCYRIFKRRGFAEGRVAPGLGFESYNLTQLMAHSLCFILVVVDVISQLCPGPNHHASLPLWILSLKL